MTKVATRVSYGEKLSELAKKDKRIVVLDADLAEATKTSITKKNTPSQHFDCGIAEGNMVVVAAGMATEDLIPFVSSFAMFLAGRAYEQIRNSIGYPHLNVKIAATHAGITVGEDGASHQCNEDIGLMRMIPGMTVLCPSDDIEARECVKVASKYIGPVYLRFSRFASPVVHKEGYKFEIGKGELIKDGTDITLISTGIVLNDVIEASKRLEEKGISTKVVNMCSIKPIDEELVKECAKCGKIATIEEHSTIGGLGDAVLSVLASNPVPTLKIGVNDVFGHSASAQELLHEHGLDAEGIYNKIISTFY